MPSSLRSARIDVLVGHADGSVYLPVDPDGRTAPTFGQYALEWIERRRRAGKLDWKLHERRLRLHAFPVLGRERLAALTRPAMLAYARSLSGKARADGSRSLSSRTIKNIADSVKAVFTDAAEEGLITSNPCAWNARKHLPPVTDTDPLRRVSGYLRLHEVEVLLTSARVPPLRRMAYALEFLTGMRPGEVAALRFRDVDRGFPPGGRIFVARAWSSDNRVEGPTKTRVAKIVPVHPVLRSMLEDWIGTGFKRVFGRTPFRDDLLVPAPRGGHRMASQTNREFQADLARLGLRRRVHSDSRATFRSFIIAARPDLERFADLVTHLSPREAKDLYRRLAPLWPRMCEAVGAIEVENCRPVLATARRSAPHSQEARQVEGAVRDVVSTALDALRRGRVDLAMRDLRQLERRLKAPGAFQRSTASSGPTPRAAPSSAAPSTSAAAARSERG